MQHGDTYDLRINNMSFTHLRAQEKMKNEFKYDGDENKPKEKSSYVSPTKKGPFSLGEKVLDPYAKK